MEVNFKFLCVLNKGGIQRRLNWICFRRSFLLGSVRTPVRPLGMASNSLNCNYALIKHLLVVLEWLFTVRLQNRLISTTGLKPLLSHNEKSCIESHHGQFSADIQIYDVKAVYNTLIQIFLFKLLNIDELLFYICLCSFVWLYIY